MSQCAAILGLSNEQYSRILASRSSLANYTPEAIQARVDGLMRAFGCTREVVAAAANLTPV